MKEIKKSIAKTAVEFIEEGMIVGLGTGTTAAYFIEQLIEKCKQGLSIQVVASSKKSAKQAKKGGLNLKGINDVSHIDITIDGADEIDPQKRMIKGKGGAFLHEKILAFVAAEMVVIVDETKLVNRLGKHKLPVEVVPYGYSFTLTRLKEVGYEGKLRLNPDNSKVITDSGNLIIDVEFETLREMPEVDHKKIIGLPGIVETGFFFDVAGRMVIGYKNGQIEIRN